MTALAESATTILHRTGELVTPALRDAVDMLDERLRLIAGYQIGWCDWDGTPTAHAGGKLLRPTLALLSAQAGCGQPSDGIPGAVAVELVHNFSLLHDDVMDRDLERRHRPTGWAVFGEGQAILAGNALCLLAIDILRQAGGPGLRALPCLTGAIHGLISGQSDDLAFENADSIDLAACLRMEAGKTAALLSCSSAIGALLVGAPAAVVDGLAGFGFELGLAFQLVDDILGIVGDPAVTGKSASSDVRTGKRSAPVVAALRSGTDAGDALHDLLADGPPTNDADVERAAELITEAGGLRWTAREADHRLTRALGHLRPVSDQSALADLMTLAHYVVDRDR
jgi:geranylgeranyl diphosphate synthase, type I